MQALKVPSRPFKGKLYPMTLADVQEVYELDLRCFLDGEAYERETFHYLLSNPQTISRQVRDQYGVMCGFAIGVIEQDGVGHITTVGVAPEWRRRGLARLLMHEVELGFAERGVFTVRLEVRIGNDSAHRLYEQIGYLTVQRMEKYYSNGDDGYLMVKSLNGAEPKMIWQL